MFLIVWLFMAFVLIFMIGMVLNAALVLLFKVLPFLVIGLGIWIVYRLVRRSTR
jgi:ABC-type nickel/cobalt efflux system permease component RcnA